MLQRGIGLAILCLSLPISSLAQASQTAQVEIVRKLIAEEAAARVDLPFGGDGIQVNDSGVINQNELKKQIQKNGRSVESGRVVALTKIEFSDKSIDVELDGGGKEKKSFMDHIQVGIGGAPVGSQNPQQQPSSVRKANGSKITLIFTKKVPTDLTSDQLVQLLSPVLDFTKRNLTSTGVELLPQEFKEAVLAKEALPGMDEDTVILALGRPNRKTTEVVNGVEQEQWQYDGRGLKKKFIVFENNVVVKIVEY